MLLKPVAEARSAARFSICELTLDQSKRYSEGNFYYRIIILYPSESIHAVVLLWPVTKGLTHVVSRLDPGR